MKKILFVLSLLSLISCSDKDEKAIRKALGYQMRNYPESGLEDIYKNFFQDYYGPGHLVSDPDAALEYLKAELNEVEGRSLKSLVEQVGYRGNFVRVDLSVVTGKLIGMNDFSDAFLKSAAFFSEPDLEEWKKEWSKILGVIERSNYTIRNFDEDRMKLDQMLERGEYVVHHSEIYIKAYQPHYRIIYKEIFDRELLSFFQ